VAQGLNPSLTASSNILGDWIFLEGGQSTIIFSSLSLKLWITLMAHVPGNTADLAFIAVL